MHPVVALGLGFLLAALFDEEKLLPKADPAMEVWDYQQGKFVHALRLKV